MSKKAELPSLDHITMAHRNLVYEPSDDTFLLCDALAQEIPRFTSIDNISSNNSNSSSDSINFPQVCLEVGSGSGCVITYLAMELTSVTKTSMASRHFVATDINPDACKLTQLTSKCNGVALDVIRTRFAEGVPGIHGNVDVLIFNPPYVPTDDLDESITKKGDGGGGGGENTATSSQIEMSGCGISVSWAGGTDGREIIDKFLPLIPQLLSEKGICFMVLVIENKPNEVASILKNQYKLKSKIVLRKRSLNEDLMIMKITR